MYEYKKEEEVRRPERVMKGIEQKGETGNLRKSSRFL